MTEFFIHATALAVILFIEFKLSNIAAKAFVHSLKENSDEVYQKTLGIIHDENRKEVSQIKKHNTSTIYLAQR